MSCASAKGSSSSSESEVPTPNQVGDSGTKTMGPHGEDNADKLLGSQNYLFNHMISMSLKCAIDLSIPDIIHKYGQPMPLPQLMASLPIHPSKTQGIIPMMRTLTHSGFFITLQNEQEVRYALTDASRLLFKDHPLKMVSFLLAAIDPVFLKPWYQICNRFKTQDIPTPFRTENGLAFWDYAAHDPKVNRLFNNAIASVTQLTLSVVEEKYKEVYKGLESLVDVGGGTGNLAKAIAELFPQLECIVFDLPHVVAGLQGSGNLKYVGGDMFEAIPPADSILLKNVLHEWGDEECLKILKKCKEAISRKDKEGKVIIIDVVMGIEKAGSELVETKLFYALLKMRTVTGKERNEKEWANLILSAGFSRYKIHPLLGFRYVIEVYP